MARGSGDGKRTQNNVYRDKSKPEDIRSSNMTAAKGMCHTRYLNTYFLYETSSLMKKLFKWQDQK